MKATEDFTPIAPDETANIAFDFSDYKSAGDAVASISAVNCSVADHSPAQDDSASSRLSGPPSLVSDVVTQTVEGCIAGVIYKIEALVDTVGGESLSIWSFMECRAVGVGPA